MNIHVVYYFYFINLIMSVTVMKIFQNFVLTIQQKFDWIVTIRIFFKGNFFQSLGFNNFFFESQRFSQNFVESQEFEKSRWIVPKTLNRHRSLKYTNIHFQTTSICIQFHMFLKQLTVSLSSLFHKSFVCLFLLYISQ